ncbi:hypothetical protein N6L24_06080 [Cognatishimia sp. SS12]|uniref:Pnap_2097 family protein n=1 Tax=Cognatishimia sp. SS12 TaxID=2979465 RepID=UPI00232F24D1|nr:Pnap_2097 family protein [Cognatishimia sp. SS12]MDC0737837.1 hypothetical protein [Cognatishimia sp. SS12]
MTRAAFAQNSPSLARRSTMTLGMAQLAPRGISEDWWLKHCGDVHWQLIAAAVGQNTTVFRDAQGRQLYAAFCASEFTQVQPDLVGLGQALDVQSELWAAGRSRIQSNHRLFVGGVEVARIQLVSTFVAHMEAGINASVRRATPYLIPVLEPAPDDFAKRASAAAKRDRQSIYHAKNKVVLPTHIGMDFNAVGLLYFPSFTRLFEQTEAVLCDALGWRPVMQRSVLYFGNIEAGDAVIGGVPRAHGHAFELWKTETAETAPIILANCTLTRF